ncbi:hypothetical protein E3N88_28734 [Mikania micrantha]|uniref:Uncharacterized protein n=1 Tax=Mikania micrantha TaxID=192012 RepID=A0A5N6N0B0_9ASTR|nr:hypothetical protein E3N88_28734 [Mikania micrantha]
MVVAELQLTRSSNEVGSRRESELQLYLAKIDGDEGKFLTLTRTIMRGWRYHTIKTMEDDPLGVLGSIAAQTGTNLRLDMNFTLKQKD